MNQKNLLKIVVIASILYFIWLFIVALNETMNGSKILLSLKTWSLIGVVVYVFFLFIEIMVYITTPKKETKEIKLVSEVIKKIVCNSCHTTFTITDTGVRPMKYVCPNCGKEGVLRGKKVKGIVKTITCSSCGDKFEIIDTGERPLTYQCPSCHYEGVV
ncbi:MAG: hypothetical protein DRN29_03110 [Thermoplasmata archaeon]|nr:MAG: hypothetical protein DRN29_03110 [Thermoplasmata archaeon]